MSLRKTAGLLAAFGLTVGLIGGGVGATWTDQVTANQVLNIAPFSCAITAENGVGITPTHSITYTVPAIAHSAAGSAPFTFTVTNSGGVAMDLAVVAPAPFAPFAITPLTWDLSATNVASGASRVASTGVSWTDLTGYAGTGPYTFTWTVNCNEHTSALTSPTIAVVCPQTPDSQDPGVTDFNWYVSLHGNAANYNMDWSTNGTDWSGPNDWSDQGDVLSGGGWGQPLTTTSYAPNGGDHLWVRWSSDPSVVTGPVANVCPQPQS